MYSSLYADNCVQFCFCVSLLGFLVSLLLSVSDGLLLWDEGDQALCACAVGLLSFAALSCSLLLLLECLVVAESLVHWVRVPFELCDRGAVMAMIGFGVPALYVAATVPFLYSELIPETRKL